MCVCTTGLVDTQREAVLDSFIGWATHAEQLDRQELLQLCVHALALHYAAAQSRWAAAGAEAEAEADAVIMQC